MTSNHLNLFVTFVQSSLTFSNISYISTYPTAAAALHGQLTEALFLVECITLIICHLYTSHKEKVMAIHRIQDYYPLISTVESH